jgi:hypothetical protein
MEKHYVDPNSGAAPQPGGYAGPEAAEKGFALPNQEARADTESSVTEEPKVSEYEAPGGAGMTKTVDEIAAAAEENNPPQEKTEEEQQLLEARSNPRKVLSDLDEGDSASKAEATEPGAEQDASVAAAVEHQGINPEVDGAEEEGSYDPSEHSVAEVNEYLKENPEQRDVVLAAERKGQARKGLVGE